MSESLKRVFFGLETHAPWPFSFPKGRLLDSSQRHLTLAFLGSIPFNDLSIQLKNFPLDLHVSPVGMVGYFDQLLALPLNKPHVLAYHAKWYPERPFASSFQQTLKEWLQQDNFPVSLDQEWLPHVTICRQPFSVQEWMDDFQPLPFFHSGIHLYESLGNLEYKSLWSYPFQLPFEEMSSKTNKIILIRGSNLFELYYHAFTALAFMFPSFVSYYVHVNEINLIEDVIHVLNHCIDLASKNLGKFLKAHISIEEINHHSNRCQEWQLILDT